VSPSVTVRVKVFDTVAGVEALSVTFAVK